MNLLNRIAYDSGGYTVQEILSSFCNKILEIIDLVNKNEEVCDETRTVIENIRNEVVPRLVDDIIKEMQDNGYFNNLVNITLIEQLRTEITTLLNQTITDYTTRLDNFSTQLYTTKNDLTKKRDITVKITNEDLDISNDSKKIQLLNLSDEVIGAMSGHTTVRPTLGEKEVTRDKIADYANDRLQVTDEVLSMYPFQKRATLKHNKTNNESIEILKKAIKRIELYNADEKRKYFLNYINRSNDGNNILTIIIKNDLDVIVANIDKWYYDFQAGVNKVELNEQNNSGVKCYLYIDFSIFTAGYGYYNMEYDETGIAEECLYSFKEPNEKTEWLRISLPSKLYGVVGQELNIYFNNIILCNNINNYQIDVECVKGIQQVERWTYTPTSMESFNITIKVYKDGKTLVASKSTTIDVKSKSGTGTKKVLFIGDSLTDYNQYIQEIVNLFEKDSCDIKLLGTKGWNEQAKHEGRSGWSTVDYAQKASKNGTINPFWNTSTSKFDFSYYLTNNSIETPDIVVIMLGTNDVGGNSANSTTITNIKTMITSIKASNSNIKIGVALTPPPASTQDGFGKMNQCWSTRFQAKQGNFDLVEDFITEFDNNKIENVSVIPTNVNLDTVNNFPYEEVKPNSRATTTIKRISDNVHPDQSGMCQFSDTYYGWLKSFY